MPRYEYKEGSSNKFWEITLQGNSFTVRYGRIGTAGQTQTKSFTSELLAQKEHDKLIAEKTKKGYGLVGGADSKVDNSGTTLPPSSPPHAPANSATPSSPQLRKDFHVYNEATGFLITSKRLAGKGWDSSSKEWDKGVRSGDLIPIELYQDDPFNIRVVVGGDLDPHESAEWTGRLDWKLRVTDGNLVICGGSEYVMEEGTAAEMEESWGDYVRHVKVPKGLYQASVYTYWHSVNGIPCLKIANDGNEPEPLGEWFRKSHPGANFPAWIHNECVSDPDEDPGHQDEWKKAKRIDEPAAHYVQFLLHLVPLDNDGKNIPMPELGDGWFSTPSQCRVPDKCPLGIAAKDPEGLPKKAEPVAVQPMNVFKHTAAFKRIPLKGALVEVPVGKLERLFRIPWFCYVWTMPQIRIELPADTDFPLDMSPAKNTVLKLEGRLIDVGFQSTGGQAGAIYLVQDAAKKLKDLPDGSLIEFETVNYNEAQLKLELPLGLHRYKGTVKRGMFQISETFPSVEPERLKAALALSAQVENENSIDAGSENVATAVLSYLKKHPFFKENPAVLVGPATLAMAKPEPLMLNFLAADVFKHYFKETWPLYDHEDEEKKAKKLSIQIGGPARPARGEELLKGEKNRTYHASDAAKFDELARKKVEEVESEIQPLGFKHAGDFVLSINDRLCMRGYLDPTLTHWALLYVGAGGNGAFEFISYFERGAGLTTTRNMSARDEHFLDLYRTARPNARISELWKEHLRRGDYLAEFNGPRRKITATPLGMATELERVIVRKETGASSRTPILDMSEERKGPLPKGELPDRKYYLADARTTDPSAPNTVADADKNMKALGFEPVGDLVGTFFSGYVFRGYSKPGGDVWAKFMLDGPSLQPANGWEFVTSFENGAELISTRAAMTKDEPKRKIFRNVDPTLPPDKLFALHEKRKAELTKKHGAPVPVKGDLRSLAFEIEKAVRRTIG